MNDITWNMACKYRVRRGLLYIALIAIYVWAENATF